MKLASFWSKLASGMRRVVRKLVSTLEAAPDGSSPIAQEAVPPAALALLVAALETAWHTHTRAHMGGASPPSSATTVTPATTIFHAAGGAKSYEDESSDDIHGDRGTVGACGGADAAGASGGGGGGGGSTTSLRPWEAWLKKERGGGSNGGGGSGGAGSISGGLTRKLPDMVYQAERLEAELLKLKATCGNGGGSGNNSDSNGDAVDGGGSRALWHRLHRALAGLDTTFAHSLVHARSDGAVELVSGVAADGDDDMSGSGDDGGEGGAGRAARALPSSQVPSSRRGRKVRLRSRNQTVDDWLADEDGTDAYADLEDFIV